MGKRIGEKTRNKIIEDYKAGLDVEQIRSKNGITESTIKNVIKEYRETESKEKSEGQPALSYGERKAAEKDPAYIPQRRAGKTSAKNPFLGKKGHIDGTNTPPKEDEKPHGILFGYSRELEALNHELEQKEKEDEEVPEEPERITEAHPEVPASEETPEAPDTMENTETVKIPNVERRPDKWERIYYAGSIMSAILAGKNVLVANLRSRSKKMPVGVYDADDLEVWQLKELLNNEDSLFFITKE